MGVFDDKKFEELDWVSQITETIESGLNVMLAKMPERFQLDLDTVLSFMSSNVDFSAESVARQVSYLIPKADRPKLSWAEEHKIWDCFSLEATNDLSINFETMTMIGEIFLVKIIPTLDDDVVLQHMGSEGIQALGRMNERTASIGRANEVMELLGGCEADLKNRSMRRKVYAIRRRLEKIFKTNEWRIRDTILANKVGNWIADYIQNGNLASFSNFCKLKVMTHQNMPIYSVQEQE